MNGIYRVCAKTNVGLHRSSNEDAILIDDLIIQSDVSEYCSTVSPRPGIGTAIFVADGLGGLPGGAQASHCALNAMKELVQDTSQIFDSDKIIHYINNKVIDEGYRMRMPRMSTTLSGALLQAEKIALLNVGDSRVYQFQSGTLRCLTRDHNLSSMPDSGEGSQHMLTNCIGSNECFVDSQLIHYPHEETIYLVCSDGLHGYVNDDVIEQNLTDHSSDLTTCVNHLVNASLAAGGWDNVSLIAIKIS